MIIDPFYLKILLLSAGIAFVLTPVVRFLAIRAQIMDIPSNIKMHHKPTPRLGGIAIYFGFLGSLLLTESLTSQQEGVVIGASLALIIGILDDARSVPAVIKLAFLFGITWFLATRGVVLHLVPANLPFADAANFMLTLFWVVGVTSAFNAMDNMDGLAAGITVIASLAYAYVAIQNGLWAWGALAMALTGGCLGFLFFNFPPASIFMGDSGSFFLGYSLAVVSVMGQWSTNPIKAMMVPVFILGLPIFDLMYVVFRRHNKKITKSIREIITFSAKDHFSHRLLNLGMSQKQVLFYTYAVMVALGMGAVAMRYVRKVEAVMLCIQFIIVAFLIVILMEVGSKRKNDKSQFDA